MKAEVLRLEAWNELENWEAGFCSWMEDGSVRKRVVWKSRGPEVARAIGRLARTMERVDVAVLKWEGRLERGV